MFDWNTGRGNARADVLKLLLTNVAVGSQFVATTTRAGAAVVARGFVSANDGQRKVLVRREFDRLFDVSHLLFAQLINTKMHYDVVSIGQNTYVLEPFEVKIVNL